MAADATMSLLHREAQKHALARKAEEARLQAQRELEARLMLHPQSPLPPALPSTLLRLLPLSGLRRLGVAQL